MLTRQLGAALILCAAVSQTISFAADYYIAPTGSAAGDGSITKPWDLTTAFAHPAAVQPGDTLWMRAGVYPGIFISNLKGSATAPVVLRGYPGERAVIDGSRAGMQLKNLPTLRVKGPYLWLRDIEITNSDPERVIAVSGSNPPERRGSGLDIEAAGVKAINLIVHDAGQGVSAYAAAPDVEVYGSLIYNNGWEAPDRGHGHGYYAQNNTGKKQFNDNILLQTFGDTMHIYGSSDSFMRNFEVIGNTMFNGRLLIGGNAPVENMQFHENMTYQNTMEFGYGAPGNYGLNMTRNYLMNGASFLYWKNFTATNNTFYGSVDNGSMRSMVITPQSGVLPTSYKLSSNTYFQSNPNGLDFRYGNLMLWTAWRLLGFDANSTYVPMATSNRKPAGIKVFVRKNKYDPNRATIVIYNWSLGSTVPVDLSGVLSAGDNYELRNALDYYNDIIPGTYSGGSVFVPMVGRTMAPAHGYPGTVAGAQNTFPEFGTFILIRKPKAAIQISPTTISLGPNAQKQFTATVTQNANTAVRWSISPSVGTISATGLYTAPASITTPQTVTVSAMSLANETVIANATVSLVPPVTVTVAAASSVLAGAKLQAVATVTGTTNTAVTWSVSPAVGSVSSTGLYTAPATVSASTAVTITARSAANTSVFGSAVITVLPATAAASVSAGILNPGFESQTQNWALGTSPGRVLTATPRSGSWSLLIYGVSTEHRNVYQDVAVVPGKAIAFSGWMKTANVTVPAEFRLTWLTATGAPAGTVVAGGVKGTSAWVNVTSTVTPPATAAKVRVEAIVPQSTATSVRVLFDDITVK